MLRAFASEYWACALFFRVKSMAHKVKENSIELAISLTLHINRDASYSKKIEQETQ